MAGSDRTPVSLERSREDYCKYSRLIRSYVRSELDDRLSAEDREVLRELELRDAIEGQPISDAYSEARRRLCAKRDSMTPVEIAEEWSRMVLEWRTRNVARYRKGLDALSEAGRAVVEEYLATEIVPGLNLPAEGDATLVALEDPEGFMEEVEIECYFVEHGEYPPEVQQAFEEFERRMREDDWQEPDR
jgi:hypothetical protein